jgi:Holliday junction resolvase
MGAYERRKGAVGERELSEFLREHLKIEAARSARNGVNQAEDIFHSLPGLHIECKRVERLNVTAAMEQANVAAGGKIPSVWHRRNRGEWLVTVRGEDLISLAHLLITITEQQMKVSK